MATLQRDSQLPEKRFRVQGKAAKLHKTRAFENLAESGYGTGKTFGLLIYSDKMAWENPGCRILWVRRTRKSMNVSPLPEFEREVLFQGHPALKTGAKHYKDRESYEYPGGSLIYLAGFDSQDKIDDVLSSKWDIIIYFQGEQGRLEDYEKLLSRQRHFMCALREHGRGGPDRGELLLRKDGKTPIDDGHRMFLDVNPAHPGHWIPKRFGLIKGTSRWEPPPGRAVFSFRHSDNPMWWDAKRKTYRPEGRAYVGGILEQLTGLRRERGLLHRWVSAEGMIWEDFDEAAHVIAGKVEPIPGERARLTVPGWEKPVELRWFMGSMDWGFDEPACFGCFGFDADGRAYMIREEYRRKLSHDEWAEKIGAIHKDFPMRIITIDTQPALEKSLNRWLSDYYGGRDVGGIVHAADKTRDEGEKAGLDIVRSRLKRRPDGTRGLYFLLDALVEPDPELRGLHQPLSVIDEIPSYVYRMREEGKVYKEEPDPLCTDHGCDMLRYFAKWAWGKDLSVEKPVEVRPVATNPIDWHYEKRHLEMVKSLERRPEEEARKGKWG